MTHIEIGGKLRPFALNTGTFAMAASKGLKISDSEMKNFSTAIVPKFVYIGLLLSDRSLTRDQVNEWLMEVDDDTEINQAVVTEFKRYAKSFGTPERRHKRTLFGRRNK